MKQTTQTADYQQQAADFLKATQTTFKATFLKNDKYFPDDKDSRDIYEIELKRGSRVYTFNFGQSIMDSQYYQDQIKERTYTLSGACRTGNYKLLDIQKYKNSFGFGRGLKLVPGKAPTPYDVLASLTKYEPGTFENFCSDYGYDTDSRTAERTYKAVCDEWLNVSRLFTDSEIEQLQEIQ